MTATTRTALVLTLIASVAGCDEKSAPQTQAKQATQSPISSPTPATTSTPQVDEQQLANGFVKFADRFTKRMQEKFYADGWWVVESADVERTQAVLQPYKGKLVCKIEQKNETSWRYSAVFNRVDGSWKLESGETEVVQKGPTFSTPLIAVFNNTLTSQSKIVCDELAK